MAEIKINQISTGNSPEMIDLKAEAEKGNLEAITAFKSLRGGRGGRKPCWCKPSLF